MWILCLMIFIVSGKLPQNLTERLVGYNGKSLVFNDTDVKDMLFNEYPDVFILFYHGKLGSSDELIGNWNKAAKKNREEAGFTKWAQVDLSKDKKAFKKLKLIQHPCAVYLVPGYYYNYTGAFDSKSLQEYVAKQKYLRSPAFETPKPLKFIDYLEIFVGQLMKKNPQVLASIAGTGILVFLLLIGTYVSFCKKKLEIKDD
ncbi:hypothetical protein SteCoe_35244 [Stentor coeruleus]|uniref:Thioredoxin domain-containing protein n=1 Tax=Stentor coeruleus TaxID=5963 RepID=A0A1R2ASP9_9CILI|nr:hypothetical protein SteCoe_35244 [Stentor coeruleus]